MLKISFISVHIKNSPLAFPLSSAILAAAVSGNPMLQDRTESAIMDFYLDDIISDAAAAIIDSGSDIAAFSVYIWNRDFTISLISEIRQMKPDILILAGGAEVTADPLYFSEHPDIDFFVNGEGEEAVTECLLSLTENRKSLGRSSDQQRRTVADPGSFPSPFLGHSIDLKKYDGILWELSRGCPFSCSFCFESRGSSRVRKFPLERIEKELDLIVESGIDQVFVLDPTFNIDRKRAVKILSVIKNKAPDIHFTFEIRSEYIDEETALLFSEITCSLQIGLQSSSPDVLANVNRSLDKEDFFNKILLLHEQGAVYGFDIIFGLPGDTLHLFMESIDFALSMAPNHIDIFPLAVLKGTDLYERADSLGIRYRKKDPYTVIETPLFSEKEITEASAFSEKIDLFYNRGKAVSFFSLITENLDISPFEFFIFFTEWFSENLADETDISNIEYKAILSIQRISVYDLFFSAGKEKEGLLLSDIILIMNSIFIPENNPVTEKTVENIPVSAADRKIDKSFLLSVNPLSGCFNMEKVVEYLDSGITDLEELVFFTSRQ